MRTLRTIFISFRTAFEGFFSNIKKERNFRIELFAGLTVLIFAFFYHASKIELAVLFLTIASVVSAELLNTAIEETNDRIGYEWNPHTKTAKDSAAAAVLLRAVASLAVAVFIFSDKERLKIALLSLFTPIRLGLVFLYFVLGVLFVIGFPSWKKTESQETETKQDHIEVSK